jgi:S1-C subfamily serine protease
MNDASLKEWTADELLAELRRRERVTAAKSGEGDRSRAAQPSSPGRSRELKNVPTAELAKAAQDCQRVIYGMDNRKDLYQVKSSRVQAIANAVVALVKTTDLTRESDGSYTLATEPYSEAYQLCGSEPFVSQPIGCFCSGFLVAPDIVATAGHCVKNQADLANIRFVFGFRMTDAEHARTNFPADDVYAGASLIGRQLAQDGTDWAVVRLERAAVGRKPVKFRTSGKVGNTQALFVVGHPCGLPQKYAPGARVRDNTPAPFFAANLDTYGGNSGSPVFNASSGTVEGILVRGENDFVSNGTCYVSLVCPTTGCRGEDVTRSTVWASKVPKIKAAAGASVAPKKRRSGVKSRKRRTMARSVSTRR